MPRLEIVESSLQDWKTGNGVIKRIYIENEEMKQIRAQEIKFQRICRQLDKEAKRKKGKNG